ncbi:MAG: nicotinate (nicotinamide) nucleotide adenylyltransferase, partial [Oscillospiraceae bacterium]|nr:nicotinate (nicotinamide) nucleotide adenylyltransferase [Oscillospiraceae bacterium]
MGRIGIYGGTFNPPHIGHIRAAEYALRSMALDRLLVIPSCISPHKKLPEGSPTPEQRLAMAQAAFGGIRGAEVSDLELSRGGSSYTYETVEQVKRMYPNDEVLLFMGTDMFLSFDSWRNPENIIKNAALAVFYRGDPEEKQKIEEKTGLFLQKGAKVYLVENPVTEISSTQLRRLLVFGCARPFLTPEVLEYIRKNRLYGSTESYQNLPMEKLEQTVVSLLKPNRVNHVLGCRQTAKELAEKYGADTGDAQRAALLHDVTKALDGDLQLTVCGEYGIKLDSFSAKNPKTLHALTGSLVAQRVFGENDAVVAAIRSHTTGKADMNTLEKIIYVADYMEPNRDFPGVEELRKLAYSDLDGALKLGLEMTLS